MSENSRVAMMFPTDLKEHLQEVAGPRNLTTWVLNAIYDKLEQKAQGALDPAEAKVLEGQLKEARKLAQTFADAIAATDDDPNPQRVLQSRNLPDWLDQKSWPQHLKVEPKPTPAIEVGAESPVERKVEPVAQPDWVSEEPDWVDEAPAEEVKERFEKLDPEPTVGPPNAERSDFLARVQAKAAELGLSVASDLPVPAKPERVVEEPEPVEAQVLTEPAPLPQIKDPNACSTCGSELVEGECWWCA